MHKNKIFIMFLTGVVLALVLWGIIVLATNRGFTSKSPPINQATANIPQELRITPANILSITQIGDQFSLKGNSLAGSGLTLRNKDIVVATSVADANGEWSLDFILNKTTNNSLLNLLMVTPNGHQVLSDQSLIFVNVPSSLSENGPASTGKTLVLRVASGRNTRILQTAFDHLPGRDGFVLEAIDYDNSGGVIFSGLSVRTGKVNVYANANLVGESYVDRSGRWNLIFGNIMPMGTYNISVELVPTGQGVSENEILDTITLTLPFARMKPLFETENSPEILVEYLEDRIQIGRALYGGGYQFTVVYNHDAMLDNPDNP